MSNILTNKTYDLLYNKPFKYLVELYNPDETKLLYTSNGFDVTASNLVVQKIDINQAQWDTWTASILIDDSVYNNIDPDVFDNGIVMKILFGKNLSSAESAFYGIADILGPSRQGYGKLSWSLAAKGFGVVPNYTYCTFQKSPPPVDMKTGSIVSDPAFIPFFASNLVKSFFQDMDIMPLLDYTLSERMGTNFSLEFVSGAVMDFISGIKAPLVTAAALMNIVTRMSGAIWYVDQNKKLQFRYPQGDNQGIIIKDYPDVTDTGDYTAYVTPDSVISYLDSTRPEDGFAQQLFAIAEKTDQIGFATRAVSFTSLYNKNIAFAVVPGVSRFSNMTFMMSKVGAGSNDPNPATSKLKCIIVTDRDHSPAGEKIAEFSIPLKDIPDTPTPIVKIDRPEFKDIQINDLHWIMFFGGGSGENNCIRLWHDDDKITATTEDNIRYSAIQFHNASSNNARIFSKRDWIVSAQGPQYSIAFATVSSIPVEASDPASIEKWSSGKRPVQARVSIPSMRNLQSTKQYMQILVEQTAQKIRNYGSMKVSIPNILIQSGTEVQIASDKLKALAFDNNTTAMVRNVSYSLDVKSFAIGTKFCTVSLRGFVAPI